jgi:hypothetical protein
MVWYTGKTRLQESKNNVEEDDRQQCWKTGKPMWDEPRDDEDSSGDTQDSAERWYEVSTYR